MSHDKDTLIREPLISPEKQFTAENEQLAPSLTSLSHEGALPLHESLLPAQTQEHNGDTSLQEPLLPSNSTEEYLVDGMPWSTSLLIKTLYFLEALGASAWGRFGTIYYNLHGLNRAQIGLLEGLMPCIRTLSKPLWGILSDKFHCRKLVYMLTKIISTCILLLLSLPFIYSSFSRILLVSLMIMVFSANGILDTYTLDLLGTTYKLRYGRYRMWACLSWGVGSIVMGYITDHYGFEPNFWIYGTLGAISTLLVAWRIPNVIDEKQQQQQQEDGSVLELLQLILRPRVSFFLLEVVVIGIGMGTVERLLFLYLVDDLQASTLLCGFSVGVNVLFELPIFWNAQKLMTRLGHDGMMMISMVCFCIRVFGYTALTSQTRWFILPLEVMHGITFACFYVTATDTAKGMIGECKGWNTTIPVSVQTLYDALGAGIGSIGGGWVMQHYGSRFMYRGMATIMTATLVIHLVGSIISRRISGKGLLPDYTENDDTIEESEETQSLESGCSSSPAEMASSTSLAS